jgi:hypothetical protein
MSFLKPSKLSSLILTTLFAFSLAEPAFQPIHTNNQEYQNKFGVESANYSDYQLPGDLKEKFFPTKAVDVKIDDDMTCLFQITCIRTEAQADLSCPSAGAIYNP